MLSKSSEDFWEDHTGILIWNYSANNEKFLTMGTKVKSGSISNTALLLGGMGSIFYQHSETNFFH